MKKILSLFLFLVLVSACVCKKNLNRNDYETVSSADEVVVVDDNVNKGDKVYFALNEYRLSDETKKVLDAQVEKYKEQKDISLTIEGRCDERGTREYNLALGERRANAVKKYLVQKGIDAKRIKTISFGKENPLVIGTGEEVWAKNRVTVTVEEK